MKICIFTDPFKFFSSLLLILLIPIIIGLACVFTYPVGFKKAISISNDNNQTSVKLSNNFVDLANTVALTRYKNGSLIYDVLPAEKFKKTIIEGYGNCSNLIFGLSFLLRNNYVDYKIIHLLPNKRYLLGDGHTVIQAAYSFKGATRYVGIIDIAENIIPTKQNGSGLTLEDLYSSSLIDINLTQHNKISDHHYNNNSNYFYYKEYFLSNSTIGVMNGDDVNNYMKFIEAIYVPIGSAKFEKYLYDGLSLFFGYYPKIYVKNITRLEWVYLYAAISHFYLWFLRMYVLLFIFWLVLALRFNKNETNSAKSKEWNNFYR
jgi:hypothetical protein